VSAYTTPTHSYTTGSAYASGNYVYGSASTTTYSGHTYLKTKPSTTNTILCFREKPEIDGIVYEATIVASSIKHKYGLTQVTKTREDPNYLDDGLSCELSPRCRITPDGGIIDQREKWQPPAGWQEPVSNRPCLSEISECP